MYYYRVACIVPSMPDLNTKQRLILIQDFIYLAPVTNRKKLAKRQPTISSMPTGKNTGALSKERRWHDIISHMAPQVGWLLDSHYDQWASSSWRCSNYDDKRGHQYLRTFVYDPSGPPEPLRCRTTTSTSEPYMSRRNVSRTSSYNSKVEFMGYAASI